MALTTRRQRVDDFRLAAILDRVADHDDRSVEALHSLYDLTVGALAAAVGGWDVDVVNDVLSDTYRQVWRQAARRPVRIPVRRWIVGLALVEGHRRSGQRRVRDGVRPGRTVLDG